LKVYAETQTFTIRVERTFSLSPDFSPSHFDKQAKSLRHTGSAAPLVHTGSYLKKMATLQDRGNKRATLNDEDAYVQFGVKQRLPHTVLVTHLCGFFVWCSALKIQLRFSHYG